MSFLEDIKIDGKANAVRINKFGKHTDVDNGQDNDLWDLATQAKWLAPTAARTHAFVSSDATDTVADCVLTFTQNAGNTETITIGTKVYTFQTTLTNVDGNVFIGALATDSLDNLIAAINLAAGSGTKYAAATTANDPETVSVAGAGDTLVLWDETSAIIATTSTVTGGTWATATTLGGTGARTIRYWYLPTWSTIETFEDVGLHGTITVTPATTSVIIHRIEVLTSGTTARNAGIIKATATTDATITAQMIALVGKTKMAIMGVPSGHTFQMTKYYGSVIKAAAALRCEFTLLKNPEPDVQTTMFNEIHDWAVDTTGDNGFEHHFSPPNPIAGPCIIKLQANSSADGTTVIGGFCGAVTHDALLAQTPG